MAVNAPDPGGPAPDRHGAPGTGVPAVAATAGADPPIRAVTEADVAALADLWLAVTRAGGAVGFAHDADAALVAAAAAALADEVRAGRVVLIVAGPPDAPDGAVTLRRLVGPLVAHRGEVAKLMVRPGAQRRGIGEALLAAVVGHAAAIGLEILQLATRGGTSLPAYYTARGWNEVGRFPGALRVGPGDDRDEHWFQLPVDGLRERAGRVVRR